MIAWEDGLEDTPGGPARELVQRRTYTSAVFVTREGEPFRRYYNAQDETWKWEDMPLALDLE